MNSRLLPLLSVLLLAEVARLPAADPPKKKGTSYAFLVGCAGYSKAELQPIKDDVTVNDVVEFKKALLATGFEDEHIVLMHDRRTDEAGVLPEHAKIVKELDLFLDGLKPEDTVVLVLSGHGVHFKGDKFGYFCPIDAKVSTKANLIPMEGTDGLYTQLEKCKAGRKLLIANACRNDPTAGASLAGGRIELIDDYPETVPQGIAAIYSCDVGQRSYFDTDRKRSLFFLHLTDAWKAAGTEAVNLDQVLEQTRVKTKADANRTFGEKQFPVVRRKYDGEWLIAGPIRWPGEAEYRKATALHYGVGAKVETLAALDGYRKAADKGHPLAKVRLAVFLREGQFTGKNETEAKRLEKDALPQIRNAALEGNSDAQFTLGQMCSLGNGVPKDEAEGVKWFRKAADQNDAPAQNNLGVMYRDGKGGLPQDDAEAVRWYRKAADQNLAIAHRNLGGMYANGKGVAKNEAEAVRWFRKAADQNDAIAQTSLGAMYESGKGGVAKDDAEAAKWFRKAADQNLAVAQFGLGALYESGRGVAKDDAEAARWYRKAADQNVVVAQRFLGLMYVTGRGVAKDEAEAAKWFRKAADQNDAFAQNNLGVMYREGRGGLAKDEVEAVKWFRKAAEQGNALAKDALKRMGK